MLSLFEVLPNPDDLRALEPEELGGILLEIIPGVLQNGIFSATDLTASLFPLVGGGYPQGVQRSVILAVAEALSWLTTQGLIIRDPQQPAAFFLPTRRAGKLKSRADVEAFRKGRILRSSLCRPSWSRRFGPYS